MVVLETSIPFRCVAPQLDSKVGTKCGLLASCQEDVCIGELSKTTCEEAFLEMCQIISRIDSSVIEERLSGI